MSIVDQIGNRMLRLGSMGEDVRAVQIALADLGYLLKGTGYFGGATDTAVAAFQKRAGITIDGKVGRETARALDAATLLPGGHPAIIPPPAPEVAQPLWVQAGMKLLGTQEGAGARDNAEIIDWAKEEGGDIAGEYTHDSIPWCALFQNHILTKVSLKGTETLWALDFKGKWPCVRLDGPAVGAFAPMLRNGGGHVTNVVGRDQHGNVMGLGGNQHDAVTIAPFALSRLNQGFWYPAGVTPPKLVGLAHLPVISSSGRLSTNEA